MVHQSEGDKTQDEHAVQAVISQPQAQATQRHSSDVLLK